jgi:16S rRNA (cytosine1402-N4)-methyltransferase
MVAEVITYLNLSPGMIVLDATVGEGGHSEAILKAIGERGRIIAIDRDEEILELARRRFSAHGNISLFKANYADLADVLRESGVTRVNAALFDLGLSSYHLRKPERGFSFESDSPLDMRFDRREGKTAAELLSHLPESEIERILREFGEEPKSRAVARAICKQREKIETTSELKQIVTAATGYRRGRTHAATRTFQALRIAVNDELENLKKALSVIWGYIEKGGRNVVISFHSLEDRIVKNCFRTLSRQGVLKILTPKPVRPSEAEVLANTNARSAKLRAAEVLQW